ncbi:MAG TPA: serine hydrolase domain-containing protein [Sphingomonas sp.]
MSLARRLATIAAAALTLTAAKIPPRPLDRVIDAARFEGVAIAGDGDAPSYVRATGLAAPGVPNRATAVWRWASVSKQIAAVIVMQEIAAGHLALDASIKTYWPEWPQVFSDEITIRDLLQHTSGLADPSDDKPLADGMPAFYRPAEGKGTMGAEATGFCAEHPRAEPHTGFHYDNCDFIVLGALLERITGQSYAALLRNRVAGPLGLDIGLFAPGEPAAGHVGGLDALGRPEILGDLGTYGAAGSLYGSPLALYAFDRALITHRLLDPASTALMWKGDARLGAAALGQWQFMAALKGCAAPVSVVERRGQIGGVQIRNYILPESGRALVLFTRLGSFAYGELWQGRGFAWEALSAVECGG